MKNSFRGITAILLFCIFCFSAPKSFGQLTAGDFAIIGLNGNSQTVNMAIVALKVIPSGTVLKITDQGWNQSALAANASDGLITWTITSSIPAGTIFNIAITGGGSPTATGLEAYGSTTAVGWTGGTVVAGGGDNWFLYDGNDASPNFIYGFANWSTALPGTFSPDPVTGWQAMGSVSAAVSYLPTALAAGNFYVTLTIAGTYHGDFNNYNGTFSGTKASLLTAINTKSNWTTTEAIGDKKSLDPGGAAFPGTNPIFQLGTNVSGVTSSTANGTYKIGDVITINVTFSTIVNVTGTPTLSLNTGATANYSGGTGTNTLSFSYTVASGQSTVDLDYASTTALSLNGGTIKDAGNTDATLTLAALGATNSLGNNKAIVIDGVAPTVSSVSSSSANGTYKAGDVINVTLNFSEAVTVTGTPQLALNSGVTINYTSGSGTSSLSFSYTVQAGDTSADLDYTSTSALSVNGGTLKDAAGNNATLTLATPGAANSLGANKNIVIDTTSPVVSSVNSSQPDGTYKIGDVIPVTVNFSEAVTVTGTPTLSLNSGGTASYASGSGTAALVFNYTVAVSQSIADLDQASNTALSLAGGTINDAAGNNATLTLASPGAANSLGANKAIVINTTTPTILSITRVGNATINGAATQFLITFSENVTGVNTNDFSLTSTGVTSPSITFLSGSNNTRTITVNTGTGSGTLRLDLKTSGTGIINTIGNEIQGGYTAGQVYTIDKALPTLTTVTIASNNANTAIAKAGDVVTLSFTASETIGTPVVSILGNAATVTNVSGNDWTATYTAQNTDTEGLISFNIAFTDVAGNVGTAVMATTNSSSVTYDKTVPTLNTVTIASDNLATSKAKVGNIITMNFTASEAIATPTVTMGGTAVTPTSSGGNNWTASQTVSGLTPEGVLAFNIAFSDLTGNAGTAVTATTNSSSVTVDRTAPVAPIGLNAVAGNTENVLTWDASLAPDLDKYILYAGTTINPTTAIQTIPAGTLTYTHTGLTSGTGYFYRISAVDLTGNEGAKSGNIGSVPKAAQTITFNPLAASVYGATPITLTATSSSALTVTYTSSNTAVATVSGSTVTVLTAGTTTITASQAGNSAFLAATPVTQDLVVNKKDIAVNAVVKTKVYGAADPAFTYTFSPALVGLDTFTGALDRATGENIGDYAIGQGTLALNNNYTVTYVPANLSITTKTITVTAAAKTKVYGDTDPVLTYTFAPALTGTDAFTGALNRATGENIGDYAIGQGTLALSGNYTITYVPANLTIGTKTITVTAAAKTKVYGDADPALTYTFAPALTGTDTFTGALNRATGENIGDYAIGQGTLALSGNYTVAYVPANLSITTKAITVTAAAKTKFYGDADPALTYTFAPALTGTDTFSGALSRATGENIGDYAIGQGTLALNSNYTITYVPANLTIGTKTITVTAAAKTKVYGDTDPVLTYTFAPALTGTDVFTGTLNRATGENIGDYAIGQGTLALNGNYTVAYVPANLSIMTKTITVTAAAKTKIYGDTDPALTYTFAPVLNGSDTFTGSLIRATGENIGDYAIGQGTLALNGNYTVAYVPANLSITTKTITVTAAAKTKVYGDTDPALTYTFAPVLIGTDTFSGALNRATGENIGDYIIGQGTLALNSNYTVTYLPANLTIGTKTITVTAAAKTKVYGDTDPVLTYTFAPALTGTDVFTGTLNRATGENIGDYAIGQGTLLLNSNYTVTYVPANLSITTKTITVTAAAKTKVYGDTDPALTYTFAPALTGTDTFTGALNRATGENIGDYVIGQGTLALNSNYTVTYLPTNLTIGTKTITVTAAAKTKVYGDTDPALTYTFAPALTGTDTFTGVLNRATGENIGNYVIGQGTLALNSNYTVTYVPANLSITTKAITVTATAKTKVYGDADPALTYTFAPALTGTDTFTGNLSRTAGENIGNYVINQGTLALSNNYTVTYIVADFSITKKTVTVTATAKTKVYGDIDPALTYTFAPALTGTDTFTGALNRTPGESIGSYVVNQGSLILNNNYQLTYIPANLSITAKGLTVTAVAKTKIYGDADPALTYTFAPALSGTDTFSGSLVRAAGENSGNYVISQGTLTAGSNYLITYAAANLSIGTKTINVSATAAAKTYGAADPVLTYTFSPALTGTDTFTGSLNRVAGENTGTYTINKNTLSLSSNYILNYTAANLSINKAVLTITADNKDKFAGTVNPAFTVSYSGFVNNETNAVLTTQPTITTTATTGSPLGTYSIVPSGAAAANYQISYVNGILTIKPGAPTNVLLAGVTLYENKASGTTAGILSSTSDDPMATFTYSLVTGSGDTDNALFSVSGNQLLTAASLDYENKAVYSIRMRSTTQYGFSLDKTFTINLTDVNELPTLAVIANQTICYTTATQNVNLTGISAGPETTQSTSISVAGNNSGLLQNVTVSGSGTTGLINYSVKPGASGTATITVTVKDNGGTANGGADTYSRTFVLTVNALPVVSVMADKGMVKADNSIEISKGETVFLNATGGATYAWASHSSIIRGLNSATLEVRPRETTVYTVTVTNASGCAESKTFTINVLDDLEKIKATNIMSPNGDGINDTWVIDNIDFYPNNQVKIFDKSGRMVYSKKGYDNSWNATLNGLPLSEGTYYYVIDFGTDRRVFKGYITIVRSEQTR